MRKADERATGVSRSEQAEAVITAKLAEDFARAESDPALGAARGSFGRTTATRFGVLPDHVGYNKARGFSLDDAGRLHAICAFFTDAGLVPMIEVWSCDVSPKLMTLLRSAGFVPARASVTMLARPGRVPGPEPDPAIDVRMLPPGGDDTVYLETLFAGYEIDGAGEPAGAQRTMMAIEHRSPGLRRYVAYVDGHPAAAAALYAGARMSYFAGAAPRPEFRGRGCQGMLIRRRRRRRRHDRASVAQSGQCGASRLLHRAHAYPVAALGRLVSHETDVIRLPRHETRHAGTLDR